MSFGLYSSIIAQGFGMIFELKNKNAEHIEDIKQRYIESRQLPRKKKKQVRKELRIEYSIACYGRDIFNFKF